jgi:hypothetical protein
MMLAFKAQCFCIKGNTAGRKSDYGGINYGYGYDGYGYQGGFWRNKQFNYNRSVNNVDTRNFHNTYEKSVATARDLPLQFSVV